MGQERPREGEIIKVRFEDDKEPLKVEYMGASGTDDIFWGYVANDESNPEDERGEYCEFYPSDIVED